MTLDLRAALEAFGDQLLLSDGSVAPVVIDLVASGDSQDTDPERTGRCKSRKESEYGAA